MIRHLVIVVIGMSLVATACSNNSSPPATTLAQDPAGQPATTSTAGTAVAPTAQNTTAPAVLVGAGDIAGCNTEGDEATAALIDGIPGATVFTLGDNAYPNGSRRDFADCYEPSWGRHLAATHPAAGNHEYGVPDARAYFRYFGDAAGERGEGWYSYDLGSWHVIVLNSNCFEIGGCEADSPQGRWLAADLAAHPTDCTLAYWHHPRFSSGTWGSDESTVDFWWLLYDHGADIVLNGHDHDYERFAPQDPDGTADPTGIRQFVVGTGGRDLREFRHSPIANSEVTAVTLGVLALTLDAGSYSWEFLPIAGETFTDSGTASCVAGPGS